MRKVSEEAKRDIKDVIDHILRDEFPLEMKVNFLTDHFVALFERVDEKEYEKALYVHQTID